MQNIYKSIFVLVLGLSFVEAKQIVNFYLPLIIRLLKNLLSLIPLLSIKRKKSLRTEEYLVRYK